MPITFHLYFRFLLRAMSPSSVSANARSLKRRAVPKEFSSGFKFESTPGFALTLSTEAIGSQEFPGEVKFESAPRSRSPAEAVSVPIGVDVGAADQPSLVLSWEIAFIL